MKPFQYLIMLNRSRHGVYDGKKVYHSSKVFFGGELFRMETYSFAATKTFCKLFWNTFVICNIYALFPEVGNQGNISRKHSVSATMFPND